MRKKNTHRFFSNYSNQLFSAECGELDDPNHGEVHFTSTKKWSKAHYTCDLGYVLSYQTRRVCLSTGDWSGYKPSCDPIGKSVDCKQMSRDM